MSQPLPCSRQWDAAALPACGSASPAAFWLAIEQPGPWGRAVTTDSRLPEGLGEELDGACTRFGGRLLLIRKPGRTAEPETGSADSELTVLIAGGPADDRWLLEGWVDDPHRLLGLPWPLLTGADPDAITAVLPELEEIREARLLVCTNGRRDVCCAVRGRPVAAEVHRLHPDAVWECSHTGGHRLAPTAVALPSGQMWARLDPETATTVLTEEGRRRLPLELLGPQHLRGRSDLPAPAQVADAWWRATHGIVAFGAVSILEIAAESDDRWLVVLEDATGRHRVQVTRTLGPELSDSCGKPGKPSLVWDATEVSQDL
ncbi:sucrase ferredoxin [Dermacoccaceae bacterium W4C1]